MCAHFLGFIYSCSYMLIGVQTNGIIVSCCLCSFRWFFLSQYVCMNIGMIILLDDRIVNQSMGLQIVRVCMYYCCLSVQNLIFVLHLLVVAYFFQTLLFFNNLSWKFVYIYHNYCKLVLHLFVCFFCFTYNISASILFIFLWCEIIVFWE